MPFSLKSYLAACDRAQPLLESESELLLDGEAHNPPVVMPSSSSFEPVRLIKVNPQARGALDSVQSL